MNDEQRKHWDDLKAKHPDALLLFRCGDFYEAYDKDAKECAKILGITLTWCTPSKRHAPGDYSDAMAGFPHHALDTYLPKLCRAGKRVAICDFPIEPPKRGKNTDNNNSKSSTTMATKKINSQNESANVQTAAQVNNEIESVAVGEVSLSSIMPKMTAEPEPTKQEVAEAIVKAATTGEATTKPLGKHGTLVIASGGGEKAGKPQVSSSKVQGSSKPTAKPAPETCNVKPETLNLKPQKYFVQLLPSKSGGVWPKLYGFKSEKEAKAIAEKMPSSVTARWDYGVNGEGRETKTRHWYLSAGKRYCDVMQELADALNKGDRVAVANAAAKACGVYAGVVAENKSKSDAEPKPKREKKQEAKANNANDNANNNANKPAAPAATGYSKEDVAAMLRDVLAGKALPKEVAELMAA